MNTSLKYKFKVRVDKEIKNDMKISKLAVKAISNVLSDGPSETMARRVIEGSNC